MRHPHLGIAHSWVTCQSISHGTCQSSHKRVWGIEFAIRLWQKNISWLTSLTVSAYNVTQYHSNGSCCLRTHPSNPAFLSCSHPLLLPMPVHPLWCLATERWMIGHVRRRRDHSGCQRLVVGCQGAILLLRSDAVQGHMLLTTHTITKWAWHCRPPRKTDKRKKHRKTNDLMLLLANNKLLKQTPGRMVVKMSWAFRTSQLSRPWSRDWVNVFPWMERFVHDRHMRDAHRHKKASFCRGKEHEWRGNEWSICAWPDRNE